MGYAFDLHCIGFRNLFRNFARFRVSIRELALLFCCLRASRFRFGTFALILRFNCRRRDFYLHETFRACPLSIRQPISEYGLFTFRNIFARCFAVSAIQTFLKTTFSHFILCFSYCACKILCSNLRYYLACSFDLHAQLLFFFIRMLFFKQNTSFFAIRH